MEHMLARQLHPERGESGDLHGVPCLPTALKNVGESVPLALAVKTLRGSGTVANPSAFVSLLTFAQTFALCQATQREFISFRQPE